jgi:Flp pilus assembly protein TadD
MTFWRKLFGTDEPAGGRPQRLDYLNEGLALERQGDYEAALTSYRLAHRDNPTDGRTLQYMAMASSRTGQVEEAIRYYRQALDLDPSASGAHYGLAFLLIKRGEERSAAEHLRRFLARPPKSPDAEKWVRHAQETLDQLSPSATPESAETA